MDKNNAVKSHGWRNRVYMESCPGCSGRSFPVEFEDLLEAEGFLDCENCGNQLLSQNTAISKAIFQSQLERSSNPELDAKRLDQLYEDLGFVR